MNWWIDDLSRRISCPGWTPVTRSRGVNRRWVQHLSIQLHLQSNIGYKIQAQLKPNFPIATVPSRWPPIVLCFCCCWAPLTLHGVYRLFFVRSAHLPSQSAWTCHSNCVEVSFELTRIESLAATASSHLSSHIWCRFFLQDEENEEQRKRERVYFNPQSLKSSLSSSPAGSRHHTRVRCVCGLSPFGIVFKALQLSSVLRHTTSSVKYLNILVCLGIFFF